MGRLSNTKKMLEVGQASVSLYQGIAKGTTDIEQVDQELIQNSKEREQLEKFQNHVETIVRPMFKSMPDDVRKLNQKLSSQETIGLMLSKWQVTTHLKDLKHQLQQLTNGFEMSTELMHHMNQLHDSLSTLISIYEQIQTFVERKELADYIATMNMPTISGHSLSDPITNQKLLAIRSEVMYKQLEQEFNLAMIAFRLWVFPYAEHYLPAVQLPNLSAIGFNSSSASVHLKQSTEQIINLLEKYKSSITEADKHVNNGRFTSDYRTTSPFYVWDNERFSEAIQDLLSGKTVQLLADVRESNPTKNAVKFNELNLRFKLRNSTDQEKFDEQLEHYRIIMTHSGSSYYRCKTDFYRITTGLVEFSFSFETDTQGNRVHMSESYRKLKDGDILLSPYTMWTLRLDKRHEVLVLNNDSRHHQWTSS